MEQDTVVAPAPAAGAHSQPDDVVDIFDIIPRSDGRVDIAYRTNDERTDKRLVLSFLPSDENTLARYSEIRFGVTKHKKTFKTAGKGKSAIARASEWVATNRDLIVKGVRPPADLESTYGGNWVSFFMATPEGRKVLCKCVNDYLGLEKVDADDDDEDDS